MRFTGLLPEDAPDPRIEREKLIEQMPVPVMGFVPQPALEDDGPSTTVTRAGYDVSMMSVSVNYTLWRNPADRSDPANLADLDEATRRSLDEVPPWPRPAWLIGGVERMRYPTLWEAVRTTWYREESPLSSLQNVLIEHTNHILMNRFREELGRGLHEWDSPALTSPRSIRRDAQIVVDGRSVAGLAIDTSPFVYALGASLPTGGVLTVVVSRDDLPYVDLSFAPRG
ncbi:hypothetical protein [Microbacterium sp. 18062]|uniref:hypothetical protein n=1 Tax=Microbacterium sp. 18062 TaxID=2681410 RepID=UPI00135C3116|nr:hypothetical protein [Microbacterium sp. 18062]